jgi:hypothetical protein
VLRTRKQPTYQPTHLKRNPGLGLLKDFNGRVTIHIPTPPRQREGQTSKSLMTIIDPAWYGVSVSCVHTSAATRVRHSFRPLSQRLPYKLEHLCQNRIRRVLHDIMSHVAQLDGGCHGPNRLKTPQALWSKAPVLHSPNQMDWQSLQGG